MVVEIESEIKNKTAIKLEKKKVNKQMTNDATKNNIKKF